MLRQLLVGVLAIATVGLTACADDGTGSDAPPRSSAPVVTTTTIANATTPSTTPTTAPPEPVDLDDVSIRLTEVASLDSPIAVADRTGSTDLYVAERTGLVRRLARTGDSFAVADEPVLDLTSTVTDLSGERGLLGIDFSPDGTRLFVHYSDGDDDGASVVARYTMSGDVAETGSRREVLRVAQPYANHNGGHVLFGPDGYLYLGFGDGGSQNDPDDRAQDPQDLLGKMLRLDVLSDTGDATYGVPADNPFVGTETAPEIWMVGLRNPWRYSFDRDTGDFWIADVGGSEWEEIDHFPAAEGGAGRGANLGWSIREGAHGTGKPGDTAGMVDPVFEYSHDRGASITGGFVYRGARIPELVGVYVYSDFSAATLQGLRLVDGRMDQEATLRTAGADLSQVVTFGEDADGELYVVSLAGPIYRLDPA